MKEWLDPKLVDFNMAVEEDENIASRLAGAIHARPDESLSVFIPHYFNFVAGI